MRTVIGEKSLEFIDLGWRELGSTALEIAEGVELRTREHKLTSGNSQISSRLLPRCPQHVHHGAITLETRVCRVRHV
jgi:hypothetical protein